MRYVDSLILLLSYENYFWQTGSRFVTSAALLLFIPAAQRSFQPEKVKSGDHLCKQRSVHRFTIPRPPELSTKTPSRDRYLHKLTDKDWWSPILSSDTFRNTFQHRMRTVLSTICYSGRSLGRDVITAHMNRRNDYSKTNLCIWAPDHCFKVVIVSFTFSY